VDAEKPAQPSRTRLRTPETRLTSGTEQHYTIEHSETCCAQKRCASAAKPRLLPLRNASPADDEHQSKTALIDFQRRRTRRPTRAMTSTRETQVDWIFWRKMRRTTRNSCDTSEGRTSASWAAQIRRKVENPSPPGTTQTRRRKATDKS